MIAVETAENENNIASYLREYEDVLTILFWPLEWLVTGAWEQSLSAHGLASEEVLLLCKTDEAICTAKKLGLAAIAYAQPDSSYAFPNAKFVVEDIEQCGLEDWIKLYKRQKRLPWEILQTERLLIREETPDDVDRLYEIYDSPSVKRFLEPLFEREKEKEYLNKYYDYIYTFYEYGMWHLVRRDNGLGIGRAGLTPKSYEDGICGAELGYLIEESHQGQGYCMEACQAIIQYAKEELNLEELYCLIRPENKHSIMICQKLGFVYEKDVFEEERNMKRFVLKLHFE